MGVRLGSPNRTLPTRPHSPDLDVRATLKAEIEVTRGQVSFGQLRTPAVQQIDR
jgi:hypothetical protein